MYAFDIAMLRDMCVVLNGIVLFVFANLYHCDEAYVANFDFVVMLHTLKQSVWYAPSIVEHNSAKIER